MFPDFPLFSLIFLKMSNFSLIFPDSTNPVLLVMIKAIEIVKAHEHAIDQPEADPFAILHEKGQPVFPPCRASSNHEIAT